MTHLAVERTDLGTSVWACCVVHSQNAQSVTHREVPALTEVFLLSLHASVPRVGLEFMTTMFWPYKVCHFVETNGP